MSVSTEKMAVPALCVIALLTVIIPVEAGRKVFCYYSSSANARPSVGKFWPEDIDPFLCTHVIFAFADISKDGTEIRPNNWNDLGYDGLYERTLRMKNQNPKLKVLLALGGWKIGSEPFIAAVESAESRQAFAENAVKFLRSFGFDGMDMDWEFPATRGSKPEDKYKFTDFMRRIYKEFAKEAEKTGNDKLLLTLATASSLFYIEKSYEPTEIVKYIDYMLLMTYNYHGSGWEMETGHHSALWPHPKDPPGEQRELNQIWSIQYWLKQGLPKDKLIVGLGTYSLTWKLKDAADHGIRAEAVAGATKGKYTGEQGILSYYEICEKVKDEGWKVQWIDEQGVPYAYGGDEWAGFDSPASLLIKVDHILNSNLGGAFVWSLEMDDFSGHCGEGKYPLLRTVFNNIKPTYDADETNGKKPSHAAARPVLTMHSHSHGDDVEKHGSVEHVSTEVDSRQTEESGEHKSAELSHSYEVDDSHASDNDVDTSSVGSSTETDSHQSSSAESGQHMSAEKTESSWESDYSAPGAVHYPQHVDYAAEFHCPGMGIYADPKSCTDFYLCMPAHFMGLRSHKMNCPEKTKFDKELKICNHEYAVKCP